MARHGIYAGKVAAPSTSLQVPLAIEEHVLAAIHSALLRGRRVLATLRPRRLNDGERLTNSPREGVAAWHFF